MRSSLFVFMTVFFWTATPGVQGGGEEISPGLTLDEAIRLGLERNATLAAARAEADAARAGARVAEAERWPRLLTELGWHRSDQPVVAFGDKLTSATFTAADFALEALNHPDPVGHGIAAVALEAPLYTSGRLRAGIDAAREQEASARARTRAAEADLTLGITEAYFGLALARAAVEVAESALVNSAAHERTAEARFDSGTSLKSDLLRARVRRTVRERDLERRRADAELAWAGLRRLLEMAEPQAPALATPLEAPGEDLGELGGWTGRALAGRPEIESARRGTGAARAAARVARAAWGPDVDGVARYERNADELDSGEGTYYLGVSVRWAALDGARSARIQAAEAKAAAASAWSRAAEESVRLEVERAWRDALVAERSLAAAHEGAEAAEAARRIAAERYAAGLLPLTDVLDVETALLEARLAELTARYESAVGRARLARAAGGARLTP